VYVVTDCRGTAVQADEFLNPTDRVPSAGSDRIAIDDPLAVVLGIGGIDVAPLDRAGTYRLRPAHGGW
jgi:hypothetical protein